jgi:hypothetical protein
VCGFNGYFPMKNPFFIVLLNFLFLLLFLFLDLLLQWLQGPPGAPADQWIPKIMAPSHDPIST